MILSSSETIPVLMGIEYLNILSLHWLRGVISLCLCKVYKHKKVNIGNEKFLLRNNYDTYPTYIKVVVLNTHLAVPD